MQRTEPKILCRGHMKTGSRLLATVCHIAFPLKAFEMEICQACVVASFAISGSSVACQGNTYLAGTPPSAL